MVPTPIGHVYDWIQNTADGASLFGAKLEYADNEESRLRVAYLGLPFLNESQKEQDALVYYGPYAGLVRTYGTYWIPNSAA
jgi:hypothetical protein